MLKKFPEVARASLDQAWENGDKNAGALLAAEALKNGDTAPAEKILGEPGLDELTFAKDSLAADEPELALRALNLLGGPADLRHEETALHAEALWKSGDTAEADAAVQPLLALAPIYPAIHLALAEYFLETGRAPEAFVHLAASPTSGNRANADYARVANLLATRSIATSDDASIQNLLVSPWAAAISPANWAAILLSTDGPTATLEKVPSASRGAVTLEIAARLTEQKKNTRTPGNAWRIPPTSSLYPRPSPSWTSSPSPTPTAHVGFGSGRPRKALSIPSEKAPRHASSHRPVRAYRRKSKPSA